MSRHFGALRVSTCFLNPPFGFIDKGARVCFEVDLSDTLARNLQLQAVFVDTRCEAIFDGMERRQFDCVIGGITITADRETVLDRSTP